MDEVVHGSSVKLNIARMVELTQEDGYVWE